MVVNPNSLIQAAMARSKYATPIRTGNTPQPFSATLQPKYDATKTASKVGTAAPTANIPLNTPLKPVTNTPDFSKDLQDKVNQMYDAQQKARLDEFYAARDKGVADINRQIGELGSQYTDLRNQSDVVAMQNQKRMQEQLASQGLGTSGESVTAQLSQSNARQKALSNLDLQQQKSTDELNREITDLNDPMKVQQIMNEVGSERAKALYDAYIKGDEVKFRNEQAKIEKELADREYNRGVLESDRDFDFQKERAKMSDSQWKQEFDRGKLESDREYNMQKDQFAKTYKLDMDKFLYDKKITDREWNSISPAKKQEMALEYSYSKKLAASRAASTRSTSTKKTTTKKSSVPSSSKSAEKEFNKGKSTSGHPAPNTYDQYFGKMLRLEGGKAYDEVRNEQNKELQKQRDKKKK